MRRQTRLFAIAEYLRGRRTGVRAEDLAERFGTSLRTIYRDLDALRDASLPVAADRGRGGGYALDRSYSLPPVNFTAREAAVLLAIGKFATDMRFIPFAETMNGALDKVRAALSGSAQREMLRHLETLEFVGIPALPAPANVRKAIEHAWFEQTPITIRFRVQKYETAEKTMMIRGVVMDRGYTILTCEDVETNERRHVRLDRIEHARAAAERG